MTAQDPCHKMLSWAQFWNHSPMHIVGRCCLKNLTKWKWGSSLHGRLIEKDG